MDSDDEYNDSNKMDIRTVQGDKYPYTATVASRGGNRSGMLENNAAGVGDKEGRRRSRAINTAKLNLYQTLDQYQY